MENGKEDQEKIKNQRSAKESRGKKMHQGKPLRKEVRKYKRSMKLGMELMLRKRNPIMEKMRIKKNKLLYQTSQRNIFPL